MIEGEWHKKVRKKIVKKYENEEYVIKSSHEKKKIELSRGEAHRSTFLSDADVVILKNDEILKIIEIKYKDITPKNMVGTIKTTDLCNQCKIDGKVYDLSDVELLIYYQKQKEKSKKPEQLQLIKDNLKVDSCLRYFDFEEIE